MMDIKDYVGLQAVNGLIGGCMSLLRERNMHDYRLSEMSYQSQLNTEFMRESKQIDFVYQQELQAGKFNHEIEMLHTGKNLDFQYGSRMQLLSHALRMKEAENMLGQQMALRDRDDNKMVWPLQTAIGQADFKKENLFSSQPVNLFIVASNDYKDADVEREINRNIESFFAWRGFSLGSANPVFGRYGAWKSANFNKQENINLLWSVMSGVPAVIIRPEVSGFKNKKLEYQLYFWGNGVKQSGYTKETIFSLPYDISDDDKKETLVDIVSPMISCFTGIFCDCYHLMENGCAPQTPMALRKTFSQFVIPEQAINIYRSALYAITRTHYLGNYTPVAYLNVANSLLAMETKPALDAARQLVFESVAVWENEGSTGNIVPEVQGNIERCLARIERGLRNREAESAVYLSKLHETLNNLKLWKEAKRIQCLISAETSRTTESHKDTVRIPSNQLVEMIKVEGCSFYIGKYPLTQYQWRKITGTNPSYFRGDTLPVESVNWYDAVRFCNALSKSEGFEPCYEIDDANNVKLITSAVGYRLPTEAEWEYAARGGALSKGYKYAGSDYLETVGWYSANSENKTHEVGKKMPNELGLYDMSGNVWEWCWDCVGSRRVNRGGSWGDSAVICMVSYRGCFPPDGPCSYLGFRLAFACSSK